MSTKRARYHGPEEIRVYDPQGTVYDDPIDVVAPGGLLSADAPARVRDELLARSDWSEVKQDPAKPDTNDKDKG